MGADGGDGAHHGVAADAVLDHDALSPLLRQLLCDHAQQYVRRSACGKREDDAHRTCRIIERCATARGAAAVRGEVFFPEPALARARVEVREF